MCHENVQKDHRPTRPKTHQACQKKKTGGVGSCFLLTNLGGFQTPPGRKASSSGSLNRRVSLTRVHPSCARLASSSFSRRSSCRVHSANFLCLCDLNASTVCVYHYLARGDPIAAQFRPSSLGKLIYAVVGPVRQRSAFASKKAGGNVSGRTISDVLVPTFPRFLPGHNLPNRSNACTCDEGARGHSRLCCSVCHMSCELSWCCVV